MARQQLLIFPFNGNGLEALDCIDPETFEFIGFVDDSEEKRAASNPWPVMDRSAFDRYPHARILAVPGGPLSYPKRGEHIASLGIDPARLVSVIHPQARIGHSVRIGTNCLVMAGVVLTSNATVGDHVCILPNTVVHHDSVVGDLTLIGCNVAIAGGTRIGRNCYIGSGTNIINGIEVGDRTLIGMGSNVTKSIPADARVAGNPAKPIIKKN
jgi:sugar O-acyltransferase (sialic acid O-acetyltransferase NeuD family)